MITNADYTFMMKHLPVLEDLPLKQLLLWVQRMVVVCYDKGEKIQCGNDNSTGLILLKSGTLRIHLLSREGREFTLYHLQPGETCVISTTMASDLIAFDVHIEAESNCETLLLDIQSFSEFCKAHMGIELYFGRLLLKRVGLSVQTLERALSMSLNQRLAIFLIDGVAGLEGNDIGLTHDQIARHIGSTREMVTRTLNHFADRGVVKLTRGNVKVLDHYKLDGLTQ